MNDRWGAVREVAGDRVSGASEIASRAAAALSGLRSDEVLEGIEMVLAAHPAMAPLWRLASEVLSFPDHASGARRFLDRLSLDAAAPTALRPVLPDTIITISSSSSVSDAIRLRRPSATLCMRSEPGGEGARLARAIRGWTRPLVVRDEDALETLPADAVVVGADAVTPSGVINKVKTRALAEAAFRKRVACYAIAGEAKFVAEELPVPEMFERVPLDLFTAVATPEGLISPALAVANAARVQLHPRLRQILRRLQAPGRFGRRPRSEWPG